MATEAIGALRVELGADTRQFLTDLAKADDGVEKSGKKASVFQGIWQGVGQQLAKVMMGLGSGFIDAATAATKWADTVGVSADKMQVSTDAAQKLMHVAEQMDVPFSALEKGVGKMQIALEKSPEAFTRLGLSMGALKQMTPEEQLSAVADKLAAIESPSERAAAATAIFGKGWQSLAPMLAQGGAAIREVAAEADRLGLVMSGPVIAAGRELDDTVTKLSEVWAGLIRNFGAAITTSEPLHVLLNGLVEILGSFSKEVQGGQSDLRGFVDGGVILVVKGLGLLVSAVGFAVDMWTAFKIAGALANTVIQQTIIWASASAQALMHPTRALDILRQAQHDHTEATRVGITEARAEIQANIDRHNKLVVLEVAITKLEKAVISADGATHNATEGEKKHGGSMAESAKKADELAKAKKAGYDLMVKEMAAYIKEYEDAVKTEARIAEQEDKRQQDAQQAETKARIEAAEIEKNIDEQETKRIADLAELRRRAAAQAKADWLALGDALLSLGNISQTTFGQVTGGFISGTRAATDYKDAQNDAQRGMAVLTVGVDAYNSSALGGAAAGAAFGATFGPIVIGVGAVVGGLLGFIGSNKRAQEEMRKTREEFVQSQGGMAALTARAAEAKVSLDALFAAKNAEQLKRAITQIGDELATWTEAQKTLQEAMDHFGLTVDEMGQKFRDQKLDEWGGQLFKWFEVLKGSGADMVVVLAKMGPETSEFLSTAIKAGHEIPQAMKPMLLQMAEAGTLLHENGDAYTAAEIEGLSYGQTMSEMFKELVLSVKDLVSALLGIPKSTRTIVSVETQYTQTGANTGAGKPGSDRNEVEFPNFASGGIGDFGDGTLAMLHGREMVVPLDGTTNTGGIFDTRATALLASIQAMLANQPRQIARAVRDAMILAPA